MELIWIFLLLFNVFVTNGAKLDGDRDDCRECVVFNVPYILCAPDVSKVSVTPYYECATIPQFQNLLSKRCSFPLQELYGQGVPCEIECCQPNVCEETQHHFEPSQILHRLENPIENIGVVNPPREQNLPKSSPIVEQNEHTKPDEHRTPEVISSVQKKDHITSDPASSSGSGNESAKTNLEVCIAQDGSRNESPNEVFGLGKPVEILKENTVVRPPPLGPPPIVKPPVEPPTCTQPPEEPCTQFVPICYPDEPKCTACYPYESQCYPPICVNPRYFCELYSLYNKPDSSSPNRKYLIPTQQCDSYPGQTQSNCNINQKDSRGAPRKEILLTSNFYDQDYLCKLFRSNHNPKIEEKDNRGNKQHSRPTNPDRPNYCYDHHPPSHHPGQDHQPPLRPPGQGNHRPSHQPGPSHGPSSHQPGYDDHPPMRDVDIDFTNEYYRDKLRSSDEQQLPSHSPGYAHHPLSHHPGREDHPPMKPKDFDVDFTSEYYRDKLRSSHEHYLPSHRSGHVHHPPSQHRIQGHHPLSHVPDHGHKPPSPPPDHGPKPPSPPPDHGHKPPPDHGPKPPSPPPPDHGHKPPTDHGPKPPSPPPPDHGHKPPTDHGPKPPSPPPDHGHKPSPDHGHKPPSPPPDHGPKPSSPPPDHGHKPPPDHGPKPPSPPPDHGHIPPPDHGPKPPPPDHGHKPPPPPPDHSLKPSLPPPYRHLINNPLSLPPENGPKPPSYIPAKGIEPPSHPPGHDQKLPSHLPVDEDKSIPHQLDLENGQEEIALKDIVEEKDHHKVVGSKKDDENSEGGQEKHDVDTSLREEKSDERLKS